MKPEKMTHEELESLYDGLQDAKLPRSVQRLRAHIAALEAERDEVVGLAEQKATALAVMCNERDEWKARAESRQEEIERQMAERQREWQGKQNEAAAYQRERDALHERVQALEAEVEDAGRLLGKVCVYATLGPDEAPADEPDHAATAAMWRVVQEKNAAESRLAASRQRAGDTERLILEYQRSGMVSVASFILGDAPESGRCVNQQPRSPESERHLVQIVRSTEAMVRGMSASPEVCAEPTTAEAFATLAALCALAKHYGHRGKTAMGEKSLFLLKRRMGALKSALTELAELMDGVVDGSYTPDNFTTQPARSALTAAPPVFTLEEVERAAGEVCTDEFWASLDGYDRDDIIRKSVRAVVERLAALRR